MKNFLKLFFILGFVPLSTLINFHTSPSSAQASLFRMKAGFSINSVALVDNAASLGVNTAFSYGTPFSPSDPVGAEMQAKGMHEIDAGVSSDLFYYECHRTHTVAPPPAGTANSYCATDLNPSMNSLSALLAAIQSKLQADTSNPLITGFWVLDDWPVQWDAGSAKNVLPAIHALIAQYAPHRPAICGFAVDITPPGVNIWDTRLALNYSNAGCDMVGIYAYAAMTNLISNGSQLDYTMSLPLASVYKALSAQGWRSRNAPFIGIGQAFAGSYAGRYYEPGINRQQMLAEATAFCKAGAASIGWYAWEDSGFVSQSITPTSSTEVQTGITNSIAACQAIWGGHNPL